jgi:hypothetical protein
LVLRIWGLKPCPVGGVLYLINRKDQKSGIKNREIEKRKTK